MTTLSAQPNTLHTSLIRSLSGADPEPALEQAMLQLARGADLPLLLAMIKALVNVGLAGIAARLLRSASGLLAAQPQLAVLAQQLDEMPSGEIPAAAFRQRLDANRQILIHSNPQFAKLNLDGAPDPAVRVFTSAKGNHYIIHESSNGRLEFVFPFADQVAHAAAARLEQPAVGTAYLLIGVPSIPLWRRLLDLRHDVGYLPPLYVVEPEVDAFKIWLGCIDDVRLVQDQRISFFVGEGAVEEYTAWMSDHPMIAPATSTITSIRPRWQPPRIDSGCHEQIRIAHRDRHGRIKHEMNSWYAGKDAAYWRQRFATAGIDAPPLRIAGLTSRFSTVMQHAMRDLASAFARQGCEFEVIKQSADHLANVDVAGELNRLRPDLIIVINHLRCELLDAIPLNIPYVCWIQDYMQQLWTAEAGASIGEFDLVLGHSPAVMSSVYGYPADRFLPTHNLTSTDVFSADPVAPADLDEHRCDLSYVGHGWESADQLIQEISGGNAEFGRYMRELASLVRAALDDRGFITTQELVGFIVKAERASGHPELAPYLRRSLIVPAAQRIIDRIVRHQTLEWAAEWALANKTRLRIYGNGWERHPTLNRFACGSVEHGYPLRCVYQASAINLQVNAYGSMHQRLLDGLAAGGFMLTRFNSADFIREPHLRIQQFIVDEGIADLADLLNRAACLPELREALEQVERLTGTRLALLSDPVRAAHVAEHLKCASLASECFTDAGLFDVLRGMVSVPHRAAADLEGFCETTFATKSQMHAMLDMCRADPQRRASLTARMRRSVMQHDTYDALAKRIRLEWESRWSKGSAA